MKILLQFNENSSSNQFQCNEIQFKHPELNIRELFYQELLLPFLTNKMEEHLCSLADSLGECSRLVSQVLASTSSSSNTNVPDSVTQVVSENNLSSRSNVSSAVEPA